MEVEIRVAVASELAGVLACDPLDRSGFLTGAVERGECAVAVSADVVVGFVVVSPGHFFGRDFVELLIVSEPARRQGVGRALLGRAVAEATGDVWTSTNASNVAMRGLLGVDRWTFAGELVGLDEADPELFFFSSP